MADEESEPAPDEPVPEGDIVYRRVRADGVNVVPTDEGERPSSAAFEPDADGLSVYLQSELAKLALGPEDVARDMPGYRVVAFSVADLLSLGLEISRDPNPEDAIPRPIDPAHALIKFPPLGKKAMLRMRRSISRLAEWA